MSPKGTFRILSHPSWNEVPSQVSYLPRGCPISHITWRNQNFIVHLLSEVLVQTVFLAAQFRRSCEIRILPWVFHPSPHSHPRQSFVSTDSASCSMPVIYCCCPWSTCWLHARSASTAWSSSLQSPGAGRLSSLLLGGGGPAESSLSRSPSGRG